MGNPEWVTKLLELKKQAEIDKKAEKSNNDN